MFRKSRKKLESCLDFLDTELRFLEDEDKEDVLYLIEFLNVELKKMESESERSKHDKARNADRVKNYAKQYYKTHKQYYKDKLKERRRKIKEAKINE